MNKNDQTCHEIPKILNFLKFDPNYLVKSSNRQSFATKRSFERPQNRDGFFILSGKGPNSL